MLAIEKGVPIPDNRIKTGLYPALRSMDVGDSVFIAGAKKNVATAAFSKHRPRTFTLRKVEGGIRIWRTA